MGISYKGSSMHIHVLVLHNYSTFIQNIMAICISVLFHSTLKITTRKSFNMSNVKIKYCSMPQNACWAKHIILILNICKINWDNRNWNLSSQENSYIDNSSVAGCNGWPTVHNVLSHPSYVEHKGVTRNIINCLPIFATNKTTQNYIIIILYMLHPRKSNAYVTYIQVIKMRTWLENK